MKSPTKPPYVSTFTKWGIGAPRPFTDPRIELNLTYVNQLNSSQASSAQSRLQRDWLRMHKALTYIASMRSGEAWAHAANLANTVISEGTA